MRGIAVLVALLAGCAQPEPEGPRDRGPDLGPTSPGDPGDPPTGATPPITPPVTTPTPTPTDPCAADPTLAVTAVTPRAGRFSTLLEVDVTLSAAATVAVQCTADSDPAEIFLAESAVSATTHTVRLSGLLPDTTYSCSAAAVCPSTGGPATAFGWATDPPPTDLRPLVVDVDPKLGMDGAWTLAPFSQSSFGAGTTWLVIWGPDGRVRWWWPLPSGVGMWVEARYDLATAEIVWGGGMDEDGHPRALDLWDGETFALAPAGWQQTEFHHDGKRLSDGRYMTLEIRENHAGNSSWDGFGVRIHDPVTGLVDFDFDSQVLVDAGVLEEGSFFDSDPYHANWVDWQDTKNGPEVYVSLCLSEQVLALDALTGDLRWLLGRGLGWTVVDATGAVIGEDALPRCQHGLEVDGDRVLVYDNGQGRNQSRAQEWRIDAATMTAELLWSWTEPGWHEEYLGDIDWLPNGRVLVTEATMFGDADIVEVVVATGEVASRTTLEDGYTYRADRYDGCDLFTSVAACATLAERHTVLTPLLTP